MARAFVLVGMNIGYQPEKTRETILMAAYEEVYKFGFRSASISRILEETGLTKGALYHHFPNKKALGFAIVDELLAAAIRTMFIAPLKDHEDVIRGLVRTIDDAYDGLSDPQILLGCPVNNLALELSPVDDEFQQRIEAIYRKWTRSYSAFLQKGQRTGNVRSDVDVEAASTFIVASLAGSRSLAKSMRDVEVIESCRGCLRSFVESLAT